MKKILAIDDQKANLTTIEAVIKSSIPGCKVLTALSGKEGLRIAKKEQPDTILLDIIMPQMDGYEVCKRLKADESTKHIPVVMITAIKTDSESRIKGLNLGADAFLSKPIDHTELSAQMNVMLRIKEAENKLRSEKVTLEELILARTNELKASEEKYKALYDNAPLSYQSLNEDGYFLDVNPAWLSTLGYEQEEVIGKWFGDFLHPDWKAHFEKNFPEFKRRGYVHNFHFKIKHKDGHYLDILFEGCIGYHPDGSFKQTYCVFQDITERKQAEETRHQYEHIVSSSTDMLALLDNRFTYLSANKAYLDAFELTSEQLIGKTVIEVFGKEFFNTVIKPNAERCLAGEEVNYQDWIDFPGYGLRYMDITYYPHYNVDNKILGFVVNGRNITERKKSEQEIIESKNTAERYLNIAAEIIITLDTQGNITLLNESGHALLGYENGTLIGKNWFGVCMPRTIKAEVKAVFNKLMRGELENVELYENMVLTQEGTEKIILWHNSILKDDQGRIIGTLSSGEDITERKRSDLIQNVLYNISNAVITTDNLEKLINLIQTELGTIIDTTNFYIALYDPKEKTFSLPFLADKEEKLTSFPAENTLTNYVLKSKKSLLADKEKVKKMMKSGDVELVGPASEVWLGVPLKVKGEVTGVLAVQSYTDKNAYNESDLELLEFISDQISVIIDRKKAEAALKDSEEKFREMANLLPQIVFETDLNGIIRYANKHAFELTGYTEEEFNKGINVMQLLIPEDRARAKERIRQKLIGEGSGSSEYTAVKKDGSTFPMLIYSSAVIKNKEPAGLRGIIIDITEGKKAEQELINAFKKATESDRLKSAFLATMSHELRTPLNAVLGFSQLLDKESSGEEVEDFANRIHKSGGHLLEIIEDIFDITLIETGEIKITKEKQNIRPFMDDLLVLIKAEQEKLNKPGIDIRISQKNKNKDLHLLTDHLRLKQILINLMGNALKFTEKGVIELGYEEITQNNQHLLQFYVKDTGIGIPKEKQKLIFDVFRQVDDTHTRQHGGTGIGLSIAQKLTELLGGTIWLESEEGAGSKFYFTIPYDKPEESNEPRLDKPKKPQSLKGKTVLIVEDVKSSFDYLDYLVKKSGIESVWAENGKQAIKLCKENTDIDLVLMDINMPVMNGYEATKEIKKIRPKLPVIAQTAYALAGDREKSLAAGCDDYISKPIKSDLLIEKIGRFLN